MIEEKVKKSHKELIQIRWLNKLSIIDRKFSTCQPNQEIVLIIRKKLQKESKPRTHRFEQN
jgi:hypothetical protein